MGATISVTSIYGLDIRELDFSSSYYASSYAITERAMAVATPTSFAHSDSDTILMGPRSASSMMAINGKIQRAGDVVHLVAQHS
jgi:hypothetical protein